MGKRTLTSCWKQFEKMSQDYLGGEKDPEAVMVKLQDLARKTNANRIGDAVETLFVKPYVAEPISVQFTVGGEEGLPTWETSYDEEASVLSINPVAVFQFIDKAQRVVPGTRDTEDERFVESRYHSFLHEIGKLPPIYVLFLLVLQQVALILEVAHLEKRGGIVEIAEGERYHTLLWAFKELETFSRSANGLNVRAHYGISWYESDWITGR